MWNRPGNVADGDKTGTQRGVLTGRASVRIAFYNKPYMEGSCLWRGTTVHNILSQEGRQKSRYSFR